MLLICLVGAMGLLGASALVPGLAPSHQMKPPEWVLEPDQWSTTCIAASRDLVNMLQPQARHTLRELAMGELVHLSRSLGPVIQVRQGLVRGNEALIESCLGYRGPPDDAAFMVLIGAWDLARQQQI